MKPILSQKKLENANAKIIKELFYFIFFILYTNLCTRYTRKKNQTHLRTQLQEIFVLNAVYCWSLMTDKKLSNIEQQHLLSNLIAEEATTIHECPNRKLGAYTAAVTKSSDQKYQQRSGFLLQPQVCVPNKPGRKPEQLR